MRYVIFSLRSCGDRPDVFGFLSKINQIFNDVTG